MEKPVVPVRLGKKGKSLEVFLFSRDYQNYRNITYHLRHRTSTINLDEICDLFVEKLYCSI